MSASNSSGRPPLARAPAAGRTASFSLLANLSVERRRGPLGLARFCSEPVERLYRRLGRTWAFDIWPLEGDSPTPVRCGPTHNGGAHCRPSGGTAGNAAFNSRQQRLAFAGTLGRTTIHALVYAIRCAGAGDQPQEILARWHPCLPREISWTGSSMFTCCAVCRTAHSTWD